MKSEFTLMQIEVDKESGMADGIAGVPYFIVGTISSDSYIIGGEVVGASSYDSFKDTLDNF
jgi:predicted DsbA family dithiol-disulfide isomerase